MEAHTWLRYFQNNSAEPPLPWHDTYRLTTAERAAVVPSIQQFQLGENAQGRRLLRLAEALARRSGTPEYLQAIRLFVQEEQRHSQFLSRFLAVHGIACLRRHWMHSVFRLVRRLAGFELCMRVLATAEVIAVPYYTALRSATRSPLLGAICNRILKEEAAHLRFQAFTFRHLWLERPAVFELLAKASHHCFLIGTMLVVWFEHRRVFQAAGHSMRRLWRESLRGFRVIG